jgi:hypothetical protein
MAPKGYGINLDVLIPLVEKSNLVSENNTKEKKKL